MEAKVKAPITARSLKMRVEITAYGQGLYRGMLFSRYLEAPFEFRTLVRMLDVMEGVFDVNKFPQAFLSHRTFSSVRKGKKLKTEPILADSTDLKQFAGLGKEPCSFDIHVRRRENATWQGQIYWVEKDVVCDFKSELEMLKLIDEALLEVEDDVYRATWDCL